MNDFDAQEQLLQEKRKRYAQQLQGATAPQGRMVGNTYVSANPLEYLAQGLRGMGAMRGEEMAGQELKTLKSERAGANQSAMANALRMMGGAPADAALPEGVAGPVRGAQAPDLRGAYAELMKSPDYAQMGQQGMVGMAQEQAKRAQAQAENQRVMGILQSVKSPQEAIAAGVPVDTVKSFFEAGNIGRSKVQFKDVGGQLVPVDEYGNTPQGVAPLNKTGDPFKDLILRGADGAMAPNAPLVGAKSSVARAGAAKTNVSVNMPDKKFYEGLGTAVSGQIEKGFEQAQSAVQTLNNANQISQSLDKALVGPLANQRLTLAQIGQTLGVSGNDATEVLQNTRNVIQGLARQELSAAGQMKGQGQITESERAILRKAEAGQINEFTKPELQTFIGAIRKTARSRIANHERNLQNLGNDPQAQTIMPYLQIQAPDDNGAQPAPSTNGMPQGFKVVR